MGFSIQNKVRVSDKVVELAQIGCDREGMLNQWEVICLDIKHEEDLNFVEGLIAIQEWVLKTNGVSYALGLIKTNENIILVIKLEGKLVVECLWRKEVCCLELSGKRHW